MTRKDIEAMNADTLRNELAQHGYDWAEAARSNSEDTPTEDEISRAREFLIDLCDPCTNCGLANENGGCSSDYGACPEKLMFRSVPPSKWPKVGQGFPEIS
jgi:hypothetical protein